MTHGISRILIIAGSDSGGGAGIQADIRAVTMLGGHAMTAITAITAQNTLGVDDVMPVPADMVLAQIDAVATDIGLDAVKIGMIGSAEVAETVAARLEGIEAPIVFDPVMVATSGSALADTATIAAFERLMRLAAVTTPNLPELGALSGRPLSNLQEMEEAGRALARKTGRAVLAKGGHLPDRLLTDLLIEPGGTVHRWEAEKIETDDTHGTGCTFSSAIATGLGQGLELPEAVARGHAFVQAAIRAAPGLGRGHGPIGHTLGATPFDLIHRENG